MTPEEKLNSLEEEIKNIEEEIKNIKEKINKTTHNWTPERGEQYYFISGFGNLGVAKNLDTNAFNIRLSTNNIFKHNENMKKELFNYIKNVFAVQNKLLQLHEEFCPEHNLNYNDYDIAGNCRIFRYKDPYGKIIWSAEYISINNRCSYNEVYFPNIDVAKKVCDVLNEEHFMLEEWKW